MTVGNNIQTLKGFALSQPPLLVFTTCILAFGLTTVILSYIVRETNLPNPDIVMDWNIFLSHLTSLDVCADIDNSTSHKAIAAIHSINMNVVANNTNITLLPSETPLGEMSLSELLPDISQLGDNSKNPSVNITKNVLVPIEFGVELYGIPNNVKWLKGSITGRQLGLMGKQSKLSLSVSMFIPSHNKKFHAKRCQQDENDCSIVLNTCLVFYGPSALLPKTRAPRACGRLGSLPRPVNAFFQTPKNNKHCNVGKTTLKMNYSTRPEYTVMLSSRDRSLVNLHLMHTSYFLFIIVITMLGFALVRGHFRKATPLLQKANV